MTEDSFLGVGWVFPPTFDKYTGTVETVSDEKDIQQSLQILLSTKLKERVMRSDFGCDLTAMVYENITVTLLTKIKGIIENAILLYEPRIDLIEVDFSSTDELSGIIHIEIIYQIRATNSRKNYVFPYYLEEGTYL
ncbi:GPW/gp25 family protein [Chryseobacterium kwangjuense]|uniref:GPW/gp25 family protein n=1 Tax=Chryseobacterium kwangjuense TaxID=267125 RepID=A0ABW9K2Z7_9FLAO